MYVPVDVKYSLFLSIIFYETANFVQARSVLNKTSIVSNFWSELRSDNVIENICSSEHVLRECILFSPNNISYTIINNDQTGACFEKERLCIRSVHPNACTIQIKTMLEKDIGTWRCARAVPSKEYELDDALVITKLSFTEQLEFFDSFNITSLITPRGGRLERVSSSLILMLATVGICFLTLISVLSQYLSVKRFIYPVTREK